MAEKVSPEEAAKLGLPVRQKVAPEEAAKLGLPVKRFPAKPAPRLLQPDEDHLIQTPEKPEEDRTIPRIISAANGATLGFADELMGAGAYAKALLQDIGLVDEEPRVSDAYVRPGTHIRGSMVGKDGPQSIESHFPGEYSFDTKAAPQRENAYAEARDNVRAMLKEERDAEPYFAGALELGGALAVPTPKLGKVVKGTPVAKVALKYAAMGLPVGALMGLGGSEADLTNGDIGGAVADTAIGGALGAGVSGALGTATEKIGLKVGDYLREKAKANALKAIGGRGGITNMMQKMGYETADEAKDLGGRALDSDLIPFMGDKDAVWRRATEKQAQVGPAIGAMYDAADKSGQLLADGQTVMSPSFDFTAAANAAKKPLQGINTVALRNAGKANQLVADIEKQGAINSTFKAAKEIGTSMGGDVNHAVETKEAAKLHKAVYNAFKDNRMQQLESVLGPDEVESLRALNSVYSTAKDVQKLSSNAATRDAVNRSMGLIGTLQGQTMATALPEAMAPAGLVWPKIENFLTQRIPAGLARTQNSGSQMMKALMSSKYAPVLTSAAAKGGSALAVAHYVLSQRDPDYRALTAGDPSDER